MAFCLVVSLLPLQLSAVALPKSQPVGASGEASRVVPIFNSANSQQAVMTGYLYSSRLVFAIAPLSGSPDFYVGLPKSLASTTGGRVKVAKVFASQSSPAMISRYSFAFNRFAVFVLEKDLIAATPAELLTPEMDIEGDFPRVTTAYSYGEYQDHTSPGSQKPCEGGPCSKDVRSLQLRILALKGKPPVSVMPNFPDQFTGQIILENSVDPKAGIACYGDGGAPVVASYRNRDLYMGAIADQFYVKACGAFPRATYDKDGKMITFGYDTDISINFISPVYKHTDLINRAKDYAKTLAMPSPTPSTKSATPSPTATSLAIGTVTLERFTFPVPGGGTTIKTNQLDITYSGYGLAPIDGFKIYAALEGKKELMDIMDVDSCIKDYKNLMGRSVKCITDISNWPHQTGIRVLGKRDEFKFNKFNYGETILSATAYRKNKEGVESNPFATQLCSKYIFIGMRGSGETYKSDTLGIGRKLARLFASVKNHPQIKGDIMVDGVPEYAAVPVPTPSDLVRDPSLLPNFLFETVHQTTLHLAKRFNQIQAACPYSQFVLAGYSQGAYGVNDLVNSWEEKYPKTVRNKIAGVFLLANPAEVNRGIIPTLNAYVTSPDFYKLARDYCNIGPLRLTQIEKSAFDRAQWEKDFQDSTEANQPEDIKMQPYCQILRTAIMVSAVDRRLQNPTIVPYDSFFFNNDVVADFCRLIPRNFSPQAAKCYLDGLGDVRLAYLKTLGSKPFDFFSTKPYWEVWSRAQKVHSQYDKDPNWADESVRKVFGQG